ncbi:MAG: ACP phosphodiesterase [Planctomycetota bacterium]
MLGFSSIEGVARVFGLMAQRLGRPSPLADGSEPLRADYERLAADFAALWPELAAFARAHAAAPAG